jgi:hypothetical protein
MAWLLRTHGLALGRWYQAQGWPNREGSDHEKKENFFLSTQGLIF